MSMVANVADAVASELNLHTFAESFTAERTQLPEYRKQAVSTLKVFVVPTARTSDTKRHTERGFQVQIDVAVCVPVTPTSNTSVDDYLDLVEAIDDFLAFRALPTYAAAKWIDSEYVTGAEAGYSPEQLDKNNQFIGAVRVTYRIC